MTDASTGTVVLGLGNPLMGDDGLGLVALERLRGRAGYAPPAELIDGGTWGMNLLHIVEGAERLIVLDAINAGHAPGEVIELWGEALPRYLSHKVSPHQIDLREVLAIAELRGRVPHELVAIGVQPAQVNWGVTLSTPVRRALPTLVERVEAVLRRWGPAPISELSAGHA